MKKLILLLAIAVYGCSPEPMNESPKQLKDVQQCGMVIAIGEDDRGDYIEIKMPSYKPNQWDRYKVSDYQNYHLGQQICVFDMLEWQPN